MLPVSAHPGKMLLGTQAGASSMLTGQVYADSSGSLGSGHALASGHPSPTLCWTHTFTLISPGPRARIMSEALEPRVSVAFAMFCHDYDPESPTDLRQMATGIGGWTADEPPTVQL